MSAGEGATGAGPQGVDDLLPLTQSRPREALARARAILAGNPGPYDASVAHQATGIVLRDFGDVHESVRELAQLSLGLPGRADADFVAAGLLFAEAGQDLESVYEVHNRGLVAFTLGDLPTALSHFDEAAAKYRELGVPIADHSIDRCLVLLAAGLVADALAEADTAVSDLERVHGRPIKKAQLLLIAANCALAGAQPQ